MSDKRMFKRLTIVVLASVLGCGPVACRRPGRPIEGQTLSEARRAGNSDPADSLTPEDQAIVAVHVSKLRYSVDDLGIRTSEVPTAERLKAVLALEGFTATAPDVNAVLTEVEAYDPSALVQRVAAEALGHTDSSWRDDYDPELTEIDRALWQLIGVDVVE